MKKSARHRAKHVRARRVSYMDQLARCTPASFPEEEALRSSSAFPILDAGAAVVAAAAVSVGSQPGSKKSKARVVPKAYELLNSGYTIPSDKPKIRVKCYKLPATSISDNKLRKKGFEVGLRPYPIIPGEEDARAPELYYEYSCMSPLN